MRGNPQIVALGRGFQWLRKFYLNCEEILPGKWLQRRMGGHGTRFESFALQPDYYRQLIVYEPVKGIH